MTHQHHQILLTKQAQLILNYLLFLDASTGSNEPLTYSIAGLPLGLTASGLVVSGTPTAIDVYTVTYTVTDDDGDSNCVEFTWTTVASASDAVAGSIWIDNDKLHYSDSTLIIRACSNVGGGTVINSAIAGSVWVNGDLLYFIDENNVLRNIQSSIALNSVTGAVTGSLWVEDDHICWISENNNKACHLGDAI